MSYEQKYLKYKQKYIELKNKIEALRNQSGGSIMNENSIQEYNLTETPVFNNNLLGGSINNININNEELNISAYDTPNYDLTETPTMKQSGGYWVDNVNTAPFNANGTGIPNTAGCAGNVNSQPNTAPNPTLATENSTLNNTAPTVQAEAPTVQAEAPTVQAESINKKVASLTDELNTTTDISDSNATDVNSIFSQLGGDRDGEYSDELDDITLGDSSSSFSSSSSTEEFASSLSVSDVDSGANGLFNW